MKNNTSNTRYSTKWYSIEQVHQFNRTLYTASSEETLRKVSRETTNLITMEACQRIKYYLSWKSTVKIWQSWKSNKILDQKDFQHCKKYTSSPHRYNKSLCQSVSEGTTRLSPNAIIEITVCGHQNKHLKIKTLQEKP